MAVKQSFLNAKNSLANIKKFIVSQQKYTQGTFFKGDPERDNSFLAKAESSIDSKDQQKIQELLEEMRGLGHYFAVYCLDKNELTHLLDGLFESLQDLLIDLREKDNSTGS